MVHTLLETLGFSRKEIDVYLAVLQSGKVSSSDVARRTGINRTTVYSVAKELIRKGVIREDLGKKTRYLVALPPSELTSLTEKEERRLLERKRMIENAVAQLESLVGGRTTFAMPKITFIEEENVEQYLYKRNEDWAHSIMDRDGIWWGFQDHTFVEHYEEWIDWSWAQSFQNKMYLHLLTNQSGIEGEMEKKKYERRTMKFWKGEHPFTATLWVNGDYLILIETNVHPHYLVEIHDHMLSSNTRAVFSALWNFV